MNSIHKKHEWNAPVYRVDNITQHAKRSNPYDKMWQSLEQSVVFNFIWMNMKVLKSLKSLSKFEKVWIHFEKFATVLLVLDVEAVTKLAASAASRKTKSREPRSREAPRPAAVRLPSCRPGASLDLGPLDLVFLEAALAADLIMASKSLQNDEKWNNSTNTHPKMYVT